VSATQRRKMKKLRQTQCETLELMCQLVGIKVIYTRRYHVRMFWAEDDEVSRIEWLYGYSASALGPEVSIGKPANARFNELLWLKKLKNVQESGYARSF
jgi:hypothetical protein